MPRGYGGTAILWRKDIDTIVTPLTIGNNRIQCIEITGDPNLLIISVYLP
jgi:exonuclease III